MPKLEKSTDFLDCCHPGFDMTVTFCCLVGTKAQKRYGTCPRSHSFNAALGFFSVP